MNNLIKGLVYCKVCNKPIDENFKTRPKRYHAECYKIYLKKYQQYKKKVYYDRDHPETLTKRNKNRWLNEQRKIRNGEYNDPKNWQFYSLKKGKK